MSVEPAPAARATPFASTQPVDAILKAVSPEAWLGSWDSVGRAVGEADVLEVRGVEVVVLAIGRTDPGQPMTR